MPTRAVESLFSEASLKAALGDPTKHQLCLDLGRLLAAFYLDFPMLAALGEDADEATIRAPLPSLFSWADLERHSDSQRAERERLSTKIPSSFGYRLPVLLLSRFGSPLEAILFADHFNDCRSPLLLRLFADNQYGLTLTAPFFRDYIFKLLDFLEHRTDGKNLTTVAQRLDMAKKNIDGLLELDVVLGGELLHLLEVSVVERLELLYASLSPVVSDTSLLPRPPLYSLPDASKGDHESATWEHMYILIQIFLESQHRSSCLQSAVDAFLSEIAEFSFLFEHSSKEFTVSRGECSLLARVVLVVLRSIYRDRLSISLQEKRDTESTYTARVYRSLLGEDDDESELACFERWFGMAEHDHLRDLVIFVEQLREGFQCSALPPLSAQTRDIWSSHFLADRSLTPPKDDDCIWARQLMPNPPQVTPGFFRQLAFVSTAWSGLWLRDNSLIAIRLGVQAADLCRTGYEFPFSNMARGDLPISEPLCRPISRAHNIDAAMKDPKEAPLGLMSAANMKRKPYSMKAGSGGSAISSTLTAQTRHRLREFAIAQRKLLREVEDERKFLNRRPRDQRIPERLGTNIRTSWKNRVLPGNSMHEEHGKSLTKDERRRERKKIEENVHKELQRLEIKLEKLTEYLKSSSDSSETSSDDVRDSQQTEAEMEDLEDTIEEPADEMEMPPELLTPNPPAVLIRSPDEPVKAPIRFNIEPLDFRSLTPPPKVPSGNKKNEDLEMLDETSGKMKVKRLEPPEWMRLLPIGETHSYRPLSLPKTIPKAKSKEAEAVRISTGTQMDAEVLQERADSGFVGSGSKRIGFVRPLSQERIREILARN